MKNKTFVVPVEPDPCPDLTIELGPTGDGVGEWVPQKKHLLLAKLIGGTRHARKKWPSRVLIDPFCGPGRIRVKGEPFTRDGGSVVAWRQSQVYDVPFSQVLIGDLAPDRALACEARLQSLNAPVQMFLGPAKETVAVMRAHVEPSALCLAYVDPYNLEVLSFSIIEELARLKNIDFAVHFSIMDLHRNVDMELDPDRARFDDAAPQWRQALGNKAISKGNLPREFFSYWCDLVKSLGFEFSKEMPLVRDQKNTPLYRLVFFSRHPFPNRIWDDVAQSANLELGL